MMLKDLRIGYDKRAIATVPDLEIAPDRVWLVAGPNGCGKTTLLKTLAGLLPPVGGSIAPPPQHGRGGSTYVHSSPVLFKGTVRSNLAVVADGTGVESAAAAFELRDWLDRPVAELSHGIRQRTSLARAIALAPRVLLVDEPEGGLDDRARDLWASFVRSTLDQGRTTIVYAAHRSDLIGVPIEIVRTSGVVSG
jgi:NitT/TauT family transport system ATP-binding protein